MKNKTVLLLLLVVVCGVVFYIVHRQSSVLSISGGGDQIAYLLNEKGCVMCHSKSAKPPFYSRFPLIGAIIQKDINGGIKYFDMTSLTDDVKNGNVTNSTILAKIEYAVNSGSMPPVRYKLFHWNSDMFPQEFAIFEDWIASQRSILMKNSNVAEEFKNEPVWPIPEKLPVNPQKTKLGSTLYHHKALSGDNTVSCAVCHPLDNAGMDSLPTSTGIRGQKGDINAPTVYNAVFNARQFWDGRARDLREQAGGPPMNPLEMDGGSWEKIAGRLEMDTNFAKDFKKVYPGGFTEKNITDAIAEFEKNLITPNSPFDLYLKGEKSALTPEQVKGYEIFKENGCAVCHSGENLGGQSFEYMGLAENYFKKRGNVGKINDTGLASFSKDARDTHKFKTPTLRNATLTAPYFHDGSSLSLRHAIGVMSEFQRGEKLGDEETTLLLKFFESLTGNFNGKQLGQK